MDVDLIIASGNSEQLKGLVDLIVSHQIIINEKEKIKNLKLSLMKNNMEDELVRLQEFEKNPDIVLNVAPVIQAKTVREIFADFKKNKNYGQANKDIQKAIERGASFEEIQPYLFDLYFEQDNRSNKMLYLRIIKILSKKDKRFTIQMLAYAACDSETEKMELLDHAKCSKDFNANPYRKIIVNQLKSKNFEYDQIIDGISMEPWCTYLASAFVNEMNDSQLINILTKAERIGKNSKIPPVYEAYFYMKKTFDNKMTSSKKDNKDDAETQREIAAWNNKDVSIGSVNFLLSKYAVGGTGNLGTLSKEQTEWLYQRMKQESVYDELQWADAAELQGNPYIKQIRYQNEYGAKKQTRIPDYQTNSQQKSKSNNIHMNQANYRSTSKPKKKTNIILLAVCVIAVAAVCAIKFLPGVLEGKSAVKKEESSVGEATPSVEPALETTDSVKDKIVNATGLFSDVDDFYFSVQEEDAITNSLGMEMSETVVLSRDFYGDEEYSVSIEPEKKYTRFTANISCGEENQIESYFEVYADGKYDEPLYETFISSTTEVFTIDIDVTDVNELSFLIQSENRGSIQALISNPYFYLENGIEDQSALKIPEVKANDTENLTSMKMVMYNGASCEEQTMDVFGTSHTDALDLWGDYYDEDLKYSTYYLAGKYNRFTANLTSGSDMQADAYFYIYADNDPDNILFETVFSRTSEPMQIDIDITGKRFITIGMQRANDNNGLLNTLVCEGYFYTNGASENLTAEATGETSVTDTKITSMYIIDSNNAEEKTVVNDNFGNTYTHALLVTGDWNENGYSTYYTNNAYQTFKTTISNYEENEYPYTVTIYGDVEKNNILYTADRDNTSASETIELDISDCKYLLIEIYQDSYDSTGAIFSDAYFIAK